MTSAGKIGLISLGVVGIGLGAYLVNLGLKVDKVATPPASDTSMANRSEGSVPAGVTTSPDSAAPGTNAIVASPTPPGVGDLREGNERTWRPRPVETTESPIMPLSTPGMGTAPTGLSGPTSIPPAPAMGNGNPTASYTPPVPSPVMSGMGQMSMREQPTVAAPSTPVPIPVATQPAGEEKITIHVVQAGDTMSRLAAKYLGSAKYANLIEKANPKVNANRLYVGTKLKIPAAPPAAPSASGGATATPAKPILPPVDPTKAYTVKAGDSWSGLGRQFFGDGDAWTVIYEHNKERFTKNSRSLHPGMILEIPPKDATARK